MEANSLRGLRIYIYIYLCLYLCKIMGEVRHLPGQDLLEPARSREPLSPGTSQSLGESHTLSSVNFLHHCVCGDARKQQE